MLRSLEIENVAVIEKVSIDFTCGLNVLTGETGAGKSIIIDSINAVLGLRTSRELVRTGARSAVVTAEFSDVPTAVNDILYEQDIETEPDGLIMQRKIGADGKSSCRVNGRPVNTSLMREIGSLLINVHGQHDNQKLLDSSKHYLYIDKMMDDDALIKRYQAAYKELCETIRRIKILDIDEDEKNRRTEQLRYEIDEIEKSGVELGEIGRLKEEKELLNSLSSVTDALNFAKIGIGGDDDTEGAAALINAAYMRLSSVNYSGVKDIADNLAKASAAIDAVQDGIRSEEEQINIDPSRIDEVEERLNMYYGFSNKYGKTEEEILSYLDDAKKELNDIKFSDERRKELNIKFEQDKDTTYKAALALSEKRRKTAENFEKRVENELYFLDMQTAQFKVDFKDSPICRRGIDNIEFLISVNAGEDLKPLSTVASGGELSRIMLAFRSVLGEKEGVPTLIFDEIDTGVSGRAAQKVGLKLRYVSNNAQVICVTHLAQIASLAQTHFLIHKQVTGGRTYTNVQPLGADERKYELARIMGGANISELMLKNAEEMLKEFNKDDSIR